MSRSDEVQALEAEILRLVEKHAELAHVRAPFVPGVTPVHYSGRVFDGREVKSLVSASLEFWLTAGPHAERLENALTAFFGAKSAHLVSSGSSANLLMVSSLCAAGLPAHLTKDDRRPLERGDEVVTPAVTFPTTLAPIVQNGLVPVFVDAELGTYNVDPNRLADAIGPKTRALLLPHTLGIPFDVEAVLEIARRHDLWLLEDTCDALGATWDGKLVGTFGDLASLSFYPAHQMTTGEGGAVIVNHPRLRRTVESMRDWGRDCWCAPGKSNTCGKRFEWALGDLPAGYDHKYVYSNVGYNLKMTDLQAAIGLVQLDKVPGFIRARRRNFRRLADGLADLQESLVLPRVDPRAEPSPFGFPITVRRPERFASLRRALEGAQIETRQVFGGNILRQPGFRGIERRVVGPLEVSDVILSSTFFVGVYPGLGDEEIDHVIATIRRHVEGSS